MKHDLLDGEMNAYFTNTMLGDGTEYIYDLVFNFTDGKLVPVETRTALDGSLRYVVGVGREVEQTMTCREESLDYLYGSQPRYRSPL